MASLCGVLWDLLSNFESAESPTQFLHTKLMERAQSSIHGSAPEKPPHHGIIGFPQICADDSDVSEMEWSPQPTNDDNVPPPDSAAVDELLPLVKSEARHVFGRGAAEQRLLSLLLSADPLQPQLSAVPIVGRDGNGKTALARRIYEDPAVQDRFELKAWVRIDGRQRTHQHQLLDIARQLLKSAMGMMCSFNNLVEMHEMVVDTLLSHRSLIVLDDFDELAEKAELWRHLKDSWFRFVGVGSKVIVMSRDTRVGETVGGAPFVLEPLSSRDSWSLFSSLAFSLSRSEEREGGDAGKRLAELCQGVPLSLKLLGSLMRFEGGSFSSSHLIERIITSASSSIDDEETFILALCVLSLPNDLFNCFAFCGIFPYGYVLVKEKLINTWIANDLIKPSTGAISLEEIGEACFHQLLCRSFFIEATCNEHGEIVQAQMPKVIHEVAQIIARVVYGDKAAYAYGVDGDSLRLSPFQESHYNPKNLQIIVSFPPKTAPHLPPFKNPSFLELKRLKSLDLSKSGIRSLSKYVCMLRKLRYLNLSHTLLTKLPKSFTTLTRLKTLDLSRCYYLKALPKKISNLSKLRHLDLSHCNSLARTPLGIGRMQALITMPLYILSERDSNGAALDELRTLRNLRGTLHIMNLENVKEVEEAHAADLKQKRLHHLRLSWSNKESEFGGVLECLEPNPVLRVLELAGCGDYELPPWMSNLCSLVKILINDCSCRKLPKLGELRLLKELELKEMINITSIGQEFYGNGDDVFPSLEKLKLHDMPSLSTWSEPQGTNNSFPRKLFPALKKLSIRGCPELRTLPSLPSVAELVVWRSHGQILPSFTRSGSPSSIVINDMDTKESLEGSSSLDSVKKLILLRSTDLDVLESSHINKFASLQHLRVLHCLKLEYIAFSHELGSLKKLDVVDCQNLERIDIITADFTLTELMIEDCPRITTINIATYSGSPTSLRKLVVRNCPKFSISSEKIDELQGLEFLFFTGCPLMR